MKKTLKKFVSLFTCMALLLSVLLYASPLRSSAASAGHISLRIEGASGQIYSGQAEFQAGQYLYPVLKAVLDANGINDTEKTDPVYGRFIQMIGNDTPIDGCWWSIYVNGSASELGVDSISLKDGDTIELFYIGSDTLYPQVKLQPQNPVAGQNVTVNVSADATTYDANWNPTVTHKNVSGAKVTFDGKIVGSTDTNGNLTLTMPSQTGTYSLTVSEDRAGNYPLLMRTGNIAVPVDSAPSQPAGGNFNMANNSVSFNVVDNGGQSAAILSASGFHAVSLDGYSRAYQLDIPGNTVISGPQGWKGAFTTPTLISASSLNVPDGDIRMAVETGVLGQTITLSSYATLTLPLQSGKKAGYFDAAGQFHLIPALTANAAPTDGSDGYYDDTVNNKLVIYTKHFSKFVAYVPASNVSTTDTLVSGAIAGAAAYLQKNDSSDWSAFALVSAGYPVPADYLSSVTQTLAGNGGSFDAPASLAKTVIALRAAGADPTSFDGYNLVEKLYNYGGLDKSTLNGPIYALLALDSGKYAVPGTALWNDQKLIGLILGRQNPNGVFSLSKGAASDPDITAMAITALAPHLDDNSVAQAVNAAVAYLSSAQAADGGYVPSGSASEASESVSQVVIALSSVGIDPLTDSRFVKNGKSVLDALLRYKNMDGGFKHVIDDASSDVIATQQALMALEAYMRYEQYGARLYDLSGVNGSVTSANPHTGSADYSDWMVLAIPGMLALLAASGRRRRHNI